jgi:DNA-binding CsgD family transcriptional regulator
MDMENVERVATLVAQMGAPFYLVALLMLVLWTARIHERAAAPLLGFVAAVSVLLTVGAMQWAPGTTDPVRVLCSVAAFVASLVLGLVLLSGHQPQAVPVIKPEGRRWLLALTAAAGLIHLTALTPLHSLAFYDALFVLAFYLFNTALVVVYTYQAPEALMQPQLSLEDFLVKYGISRREADILRGIYAGKTNQEIANASFISLQTVKDHSSRIYQKTFVKNRAQLSTLIRESQSLQGEK